jgi:hypothetical protein
MKWKAAMISKGILSTVKDGRFFLFVCKSAALLLFIGAKTMALACGYDDPKSAAGQRAALNLSYPNALDVVGAVAQARLDGVLPPTKDFSEAPNFFAYQAVNRLLQRFGGELGEREETADFAFTLVLVEPMLWARFAIEDGKLATSVHVSGPQPGDLVVVSSEAVLRQLVDRRLTVQRAEGLGLIRIFGEAANLAPLRRLLAVREAG